MTLDSRTQQAPEIYLRSYEDKDELYFEEYCRGLGDPDYYGYPGEQEGQDNERTTERPDFTPAPF